MRRPEKVILGFLIISFVWTWQISKIIQPIHNPSNDGLKSFRDKSTTNNPVNIESQLVDLRYQNDMQRSRSTSIYPSNDGLNSFRAMVTTTTQPNANIQSQIKELQYQNDMLRARPSPIQGPVALNKLSKTDQAEFAKYGMTLKFDKENWNKGIGKQGMDFVPALVSEKKLMQRTRIGGWEKVWSSELVDTLIVAVKRGEDIGPKSFPGCALQIQAAMEDYVITMSSPTAVFGMSTSATSTKSKRYLVSGSVSPWIESMILALTSTSKVYVTDYEPITSQDDRIIFIPMSELTSHRPAQLFDVIFSFSTVEHDGLGRQGDAINPHGDLAAMTEYYTLLSPNGILILGTPQLDKELGLVESNRFRLYSPERMSILIKGFEKLGEVMYNSTELADRFQKPIRTVMVKYPMQRQPVWILRKMIHELPLLLEDNKILGKEIQANEQTSKDVLFTRPPLESIINKTTYSVTGDVSWLLDFSVVGLPKCGTTTMMETLRTNETFVLEKERCDLTANRSEMLAESLYTEAPPDPHLKRGIKCPQDLENHYSHWSYTKRYHKAKLIIMIRHPIKWFQSFYNFRVREYYPRTMPETHTMTKGCFKGMQGVCADRANFHDFLWRLGKTDGMIAAMTLPWKEALKIPENKLLSLVRKKPQLYPSKTAIFIAHTEQLAHNVNDTRLSQFTSDVQSFLGLKHAISDVHHISPTKFSQKNKQVRENIEKRVINICDEDHVIIRKKLLDISQRASEWIRTYFLASPDVVVSSKEYFLEILKEWERDPCDDNNVIK